MKIECADRKGIDRRRALLSGASLIGHPRSSATDGRVLQPVELGAKILEAERRFGQGKGERAQSHAVVRRRMYSAAAVKRVGRV